MFERSDFQALAVCPQMDGSILAGRIDPRAGAPQGFKRLRRGKMMRLPDTENGDLRLHGVKERGSGFPQAAAMMRNLHDG